MNQPHPTPAPIDPQPAPRHLWPVALLRRDGLIERFAYHYARLRQRPRRWRAQLNTSPGTIVWPPSVTVASADR